MTLERLIEDNYTGLRSVALNITGNKNNAADLVTETYLEIKEKDKPFPAVPGDFIKFFSKWMSFTSKSNGRFTRSKKTREVLLDDEFQYLNVTGTERCNDCVMSEVELFKRALPSHEKSLFELYYEDGRSCRVIAEELSLEFKYAVSTDSIERLIKPIKKKIKDRTWNI